MLVYILNIIAIIVEGLTVILPVLISVAYLTLLERKVISGMQRRKGPNVVGVFGVLQPLTDGLKLMLKETIIPSRANFILFLAAPILSFTLALVAWSVIPFSKGVVIADLNLGLLFIFAISSLAVYGTILAGWSSNSKYPFLASLRAASQMISYEVSIGLILITVIMCVGSLNLTAVVCAQEAVWYIVPLFPIWVLFFVSSLAETGRTPFDLPEAEPELVSGYNTEYAGMSFALFFLGEYVSIVLMSGLSVIFFFGGWLFPLNIPLIPAAFWFGVKTSLILFLFIWTRVAFPRYRYDQLMQLGWKVFLPQSLGWVLFVAGILISFDLLGVSVIY